MFEIMLLPDGSVSIGAAATATVVARNAAIAVGYPAVADSAQLIGGVQVQNRASLGGNICNAAPSADGVPALICHRAQALIAGSEGAREIPIEAIFAGPGRTALAPGELMVAIRLPPVAPRTAGAYLRFTPRREMDIAIAGAAGWLRLGADGIIAEARVALASVALMPIRAPTAEKKLLGQRPSGVLFEEAGRCAAQDARPISDTRGSAGYRRTLVAVLMARALADCGRRLGLEVAVA
jgi:carbon-monoxide dehydrogenase medium subunit